MKLQNELYKIVEFEQNDEVVRFNLELNPNHYIYRAHFPEEPITPGVCIIQITKELLGCYMKRDMLIDMVKNVKFLSVISPIATPQITFTFTNITQQGESSQVKTQVLVSNEDVLFAKISMTCK